MKGFKELQIEDTRNVNDGIQHATLMNVAGASGSRSRIPQTCTPSSTGPCHAPYERVYNGSWFQGFWNSDGTFYSFQGHWERDLGYRETIDGPWTGR